MTAQSRSSSVLSIRSSVCKGGVPLITEKDLHEAIAECQGERNPNANTCIKLAAYYTILNQLHPVEPISMGYSGAGVTLDSETEFAECVNKRDPGDVWPLIDELMTTLSVLHPRLYASVMRKLKGQE